MTKSIRTIQGQFEVKSRSNKTGMQNKLPRGNALSGKNENHLKCYQCTLKLRGIEFDFVHRFVRTNPSYIWSKKFKI